MLFWGIFRQKNAPFSNTSFSMVKRTFYMKLKMQVPKEMNFRKKYFSHFFSHFLAFFSHSRKNSHFSIKYWFWITHRQDSFTTLENNTFRQCEHLSLLRFFLKLRIFREIALQKCVFSSAKFSHFFLAKCWRLSNLVEMEKT